MGEKSKAHLQQLLESFDTAMLMSATFQGRFELGRASIVRDRKKIEELWQTSWKAWFPNGKDDPNMALIRVTVTDAELWDMAGAKGIRYAFEVVRPVLTGDTPDITGGQHGRLDPSQGAAPVSKAH
ncbi:MAG: pyridoxamine 5'-phosphate oxidase family protein [Labilithrix sp.]